MTAPELEPATPKEMILALMADATAIDSKIRHLAATLDAAAAAAPNLEQLRKEVGTIAHQVATLRTAIALVNDIQDKIDGQAPAPPPPRKTGRR